MVVAVTTQSIEMWYILTNPQGGTVDKVTELVETLATMVIRVAILTARLNTNCLW